MGTFTTAKVGQCEHRCLLALGPFKTAEKTVERCWAVLGEKKKKEQRIDAVREDSVCEIS